jgi:hypothetical protein
MAITYTKGKKCLYHSQIMVDEIESEEMNRCIKKNLHICSLAGFPIAAFSKFLLNYFFVFQGNDGHAGDREAAEPQEGSARLPQTQGRQFRDAQRRRSHQVSAVEMLKKMF